MSSVTRFIRQIPVSTTYYNAEGVLASPNTLAFQFVPSSSNFVGNYPSGFNDSTGGYVAPASQALVTAIGSAGASNTGLVLRDMGKTVFAPIADNGVVNATSAWGYFRQVQLLRPGVVTQGPGFMGGVTGSTFGVLGAPQNPTDYLTFYIPVSVAGVTGAAVNTQAFALAGGQM
jgi:hypothetical protein